MCFNILFRLFSYKTISLVVVFLDSKYLNYMVIHKRGGENVKYDKEREVSETALIYGSNKDSLNDSPGGSVTF